MVKVASAGSCHDPSSHKTGSSIRSIALVGRLGQVPMPDGRIHGKEILA